MNIRNAIAALFLAALPTRALTAPTGDTACPCCREQAPAAYSRESLYQLDARFTDDAGRPFDLASLRGRPVVIDMFFTSCGFACPLTVTDMLAIQGKLTADQRRQAVFVLVSFDSARDTPTVLAKYRSQRRLDGQWRLLNGDNESVRELASLLGVKYRQENNGAYSHSNVVTVLNPKGEIAYQRIGLEGGVAATANAIAASLK